MKVVQNDEAVELYRQMTPLEKAVLPRVLAGESYRKIYQSIRGEHIPPDRASHKVSKMLERKRCARWLEIMRTEVISKAVMDRQEALERLSAIARSSFADLVEFTAHGWRFKDSTRINPAALSAISEIKGGRDGMSMKMLSPLQAIGQLASMEGWNRPTQVEVEVTKSEIDASNMSTESLKDILRARDEARRLTSD